MKLKPLFILGAVLFLAAPVLSSQPDIGEDAATQDLRDVWVSLQALAFKSDLSGGELRAMDSTENSILRTELEYLWQDLFQPRLASLGLVARGGQIIIEDADRYVREIQEEDPERRITRLDIVSRAGRTNYKAPQLTHSHLRLFVEIQQDGLRQVGRIELSLIEAVRLERRPRVVFHTVTWQTAEEAVPLGMNIDRISLRDSAENLLNAFEQAIRNTKP